MEKQTKPKPLGAPMAKLVLVVAIIVSLGAVAGILGYALTKQKPALQNPPIAQKADETADWQTYINQTDCYLIKYTSPYRVWQDRNLANYDADDPQYERGNANDVKIQIQKNYLNNNENFITLIARLNNQIKQGTLGDKETPIQKLLLGNFQYSNKVLSGPGGNFDVFYSPSKDEKSYYQVLVWNIENDRKNVESILATFTPSNCSNELNDWKTYKSEKYGIQFNYPKDLTLYSEGPNIAEQDLEVGQMISGTIQPSYETLNFRNAAGRKKFEISIFSKTDKTLTKENYESSFYLSGICDLRYLSSRPIVDVLQVGGIPMIHAGLANEKVPSSSRSCYYFKNADNNLIVLSLLSSDSMSDYETTTEIVLGLLSTFKFIEKDKTADWKTYRNEEYGFEVKYPDNVFQLDSTKSTISHTLKNFHKHSEKDGLDLGLANDISIVLKKEESADRGCDYLEQVLDIKSNGIPFQSKNVSGIKYESGAEGDGFFDYCIKDNEGKNIFWIRRYFLKESYSTELPKQQDYIPSKEQERIFDQILSTFKFTKQ